MPLPAATHFIAGANEGDGCPAFANYARVLLSGGRVALRVPHYSAPLLLLLSPTPLIVVLSGL